MSDRLSEIAEREKAATPGPWMTDPWCEDDCEFSGVVTEDAVRVLHGSESTHMEYEPIIHARVEDMEFVCEARQDIPWLLANTNKALTLIRSVRDGNGWKEIPLGVLNQIEAILLGKEGGDAHRA